jgi:O-methyltransferase domain/Dimerisation domain
LGLDSFYYDHRNHSNAQRKAIMNFSQLMNLATGHVEARIVQTALELKIFEVLAAAGLSAANIAERLNLEVKASELILNALVSLELLHKQDETFTLTTVAQSHLLERSPKYVGGMIRFESSLWHCWEQLPQAIRTGAPVRPPNMYQDDQRETEIFIQAMDSLVKARGDTEVLINALDWGKVRTLLDLGSGPATYPIALCERFSELSGTIFDLPGTLAITAHYIREAGMTERIRLVAGDYRCDPIPGKYDVIFLSNVIHGEDFERNKLLIAKLAKQLTPSGLIVIKDHILDEGRAQPPVGAIFSILMLLTTDGGRCYSYGEIRGWLERAGLSQVRQVALPPPLTSSLIIAVNN